jgi:hypothetical protein
MKEDRWIVKIYSDGKNIRKEITQDTAMGINFDTIQVGLLCSRFYTKDKSKITDKLIDEMILKYKEHLLHQRKKSETLIETEQDRLNTIKEYLNSYYREEKLERILNERKS